MTSAWQEYKKKLGATKPWDTLNPNTDWMTEEGAQARLDICLSCDKLVKITKQCKECGCFMKLKVKMTRAVCPLGKW